MNTCTGSNEPTYPRQSFGILGGRTWKEHLLSILDSMNHCCLTAMLCTAKKLNPQATAYEGQHQAHNVAFSDLVDF